MLYSGVLYNVGMSDDYLGEAVGLAETYCIRMDVGVSTESNMTAYEAADMRFCPGCGVQTPTDVSGTAGNDG